MKTILFKGICWIHSNLCFIFMLYMLKVYVESTVVYFGICWIHSNLFYLLTDVITFVIAGNRSF